MNFLIVIDDIRFFKEYKQDRFDTLDKEGWREVVNMASLATLLAVCQSW